METHLFSCESPTTFETQSSQRFRSPTDAWRLRDRIIDGFAIKPLAYVVVPKGGVIGTRRFVSHSGYYMPRDLLITASGEHWRVVTVEGDADGPQTLMCHAEP